MFEVIKETPYRRHRTRLYNSLQLAIEELEAILDAYKQEYEGDKEFYHNMRGLSLTIKEGSTLINYYIRGV
jgi:molybdopterin synthase catalytic subunit